MWLLFYNIVGVPLLWVVFQCMGLLSPKAASALRGRKDLFEQLSKKLASLPDGRPRVWVHSSSMGEFEQAKPIIAEMKRRYNDIRIIVSFFSPSGYEHSQSYKAADVITYIPFDTRSNARKFVGLVKPSAAIFMRYDVWPNHLWELRRRGIPTFIANATLRKKFHHSLVPSRQFHRAIYNALDYIFTVSGADEETFRSLHLTHPRIAMMGDTRYDQVMQRSNDSRARQILSRDLVAGRKVLVIGSSWEEDEEALFPACLRLVETIPGMLIVLVPHEPTPETMERIEQRLNGRLTHIRFSELTQYAGESVIIIDSIGILMPLYRYGRVAYVGGSFRQGIHNVLEPAVYGIPVIFGPEHRNSQEAVALEREGAAVVGHNAEELSAQLGKFFTDDARCEDFGRRGKEFVMRNVGATERFLSYVDVHLLNNVQHER